MCKIELNDFRVVTSETARDINRRMVWYLIGGNRLWGRVGPVIAGVIRQRSFSQAATRTVTSGPAPLPASYRQLLQIKPSSSNRPGSGSESQRDSVSKPRVAPTALPWVTVPLDNNPNGVAAHRVAVAGHNPIGIDVTIKSAPFVLTTN